MEVALRAELANCNCGGEEAATLSLRGCKQHGDECAIERAHFGPNSEAASSRCFGLRALLAPLISTLEGRNCIRVARLERPR